MIKTSRIVALFLSTVILVSSWVASPLLAESDGVNDDNSYTDDDGGIKDTSELSPHTDVVYISVNTIQELADALGSDAVTILSENKLALKQNISNVESQTISLQTGTFVIDFKGFVIEDSFDIDIENGNLTCMDSSQDKSGGIRYTSYNYYNRSIFELNDGGSLTVLSGKYESPASILGVLHGTFNMKGGSFLTTESSNYGATVYAQGVTDKIPTINMIGGSIICEAPYGLAIRLLEYSVLNMSGGSVLSTADSIFIHTESKANFTGGNVEASEGAALGINGGTLSVSGGTFTGDYAGLAVSDGDTSNDLIQLTGGKFVCVSTTRGGGIITSSVLMDSTCSVSEALAKGFVFFPSTVTEDFWYYEGDPEPQFMHSRTEKSVYVLSNIGVEGFVNRLYTKALGRMPDKKGFDNWVSRLKEKQISGADAAFGFFFSPELTKQNLSDEDFITLLYTVFFDRAPDKAGLANWISVLEQGVSRKFVFAGFANSKEWMGLCKNYGIEPGSYQSDEPRDKNIKVTSFVQRLYTLCLNRKADPAGINSWIDALNNKSKDGANVAYGFFFSPEFKNRNLSNEDFVETLYKVLLGRNSDSKGKAGWVSQLKAGKDRLEVFRGFVNSKEFDGICAEYGIVRGTV